MNKRSKAIVFMTAAWIVSHLYSVIKTRRNNRKADMGIPGYERREYPDRRDMREMVDFVIFCFAVPSFSVGVFLWLFTDY
jgi:hypothetical protein